MFVEAAGGFIYPLGICSFIAVFLVVERFLALRPGRTLPAALAAHLADPDKNPRPRALAASTGGRILAYHLRTQPEPEQLKAYAQFELSRLERGLFLLDTVVGAAPLIGLLGTVFGLFMLFPEAGLPKAEDLTHGVGLALTTTIIGLFIAIPSLLFSNALARRVESISARINLLVERILALRDKLGTATAAPAPDAAAPLKTTPPPPPSASVPVPAKPAAPAETPAATATTQPPGFTPPRPRKLEFELKPLPAPPNPARRPR
jgi:biopolymer transport protein ExbB